MQRYPFNLHLLKPTPKSGVRTHPGHSRTTWIRPRHLGQAVHSPSVARNRCLCQANPSRPGRDGRLRLPRRVARSPCRLFGAVDQPTRRSVQHPRPPGPMITTRISKSHVRAIRTPDGLGFRGVLSSDRHHGRIRSGRIEWVARVCDRYAGSHGRRHRLPRPYANRRSTSRPVNST